MGNFIRKHPGISALLAAAPVVALIVVIGSRLGDEGGHAASHLAVGVPALLLLLSARRWRAPAPRRAARIARRTAVLGLAVLGGGQLLEAIGAAGFEGYARQYDALATLHDIALVFGPLGMLLTLAGAFLTAVTRAAGAPLSHRGAVWTAAVAGALLGGGLLRVLVGG